MLAFELHVYIPHSKGSFSQNLSTFNIDSFGMEIRPKILSLLSHGRLLNSQKLWEA